VSVIGRKRTARRRREEASNSPLDGLFLRAGCGLPDSHVNGCLLRYSTVGREPICRLGEPPNQLVVNPNSANTATTTPTSHASSRASAPSPVVIPARSAPRSGGVLGAEKTVVVGTHRQVGHTAQQPQTPQQQTVAQQHATSGPPAALMAEATAPRPAPFTK
jgi:hypothetical protein